ncbi:hypothetical protein JKF63_07131 [Porcisia hertigi]|uniref:Uncharacterized protein n=1 Tax=Porcisia hertigi TaxID=2761500 RepID=A0A836LKM1_9TRYP|nr:hypothetical protein JKF63_07131 [Porcisia hertigi]
MDSCRRVVRIHGNRGTSATRDDELTSSVDHYVVCEAVALCPCSEGPAGGDDQAASVSKLKALISKYAQFQRSILSCVLAMGSSACGSVSMSVPSVCQTSSRSPSEGLASLSGVDKGRVRPAGRTSSNTLSASTGLTVPVPDVESCWVATSPFPPTAVLAALYGMTPLHGVSLSRGGGGAPDTGADGSPQTAATMDATRFDVGGSSVPSFELQWSLCRCTPDTFAAQGRWRVTYRDAFTMTTVAAYMASANPDGGSRRQVAASLTPPPPLPSTTSSSTSSYSLAQQLRRAFALLGLDSEGSSPEASATVPQGASLLDWPEEFLWSLLVSLLSSLALVHSAGLHFFGQLTAADVLCIACSPTLPRQLEQTWADVAAAAATAAGKGISRREDGNTGSGDSIRDDRVPMHREADAVFRRFFATAVPSVLLPQATVTATTPCHHIFFVLHPSLELLQQQHQRNGGTHVHQQNVSGFSAAQESKQSTPAQQAQHQAADLASVGCLMSLLVELRARWRQRHRGPADLTTAELSSELAFLVRRLSGCAGTSAGPAASPQAPTALQLLQLQALRLRTESWYYHRLAEEACDRFSFLAQQRLRSADVASLSPLPPMVTQVRDGETAERQSREAHLADREARLAEREAKLNVMLELYALTHEHLDALTLPQLPSAEEGPISATLPSTLSSDAAGAAAVVDPAASAAPNRSTRGTHSAGAEQRPASQVLREDSLDRLLTQTLLQQEHRRADVAATLHSGVPASARAVPASANHSSGSLPQASAIATPRVSAGVADDDVLFSAFPLARHTTADDTLHSNVVTSSKAAAGPWPVLSTPLHMDADNAPGGGQATTVTAMAAANHPPGSKSRVTVVEVDLDATESDGCGTSEVRQTCTDPTAKHPAPAAGLKERPTWALTASTASPSAPFPFLAAEMLSQEVARGSPPPQRPQRQERQLFSPSLHVSPSHDMQTPLRPPPLPNMGYVDGAASGTAAFLGAGIKGGDGRSHSKYSALFLLRTPPSARRSGTGSGIASAAAGMVSTKAIPSSFHSPSSHSADGYRSSIKPYSLATVGGPIGAAAATLPHSGRERSPVQAPQRRRRSSSRGSTANKSGGVHPTALGSLTPRTENHHQQKNGNTSLWAHQQLTALEEMQMELRAHQTPTPRRRTVSAAVAAPSRNPDVAASVHTRSPETPSLALRVAPQQHSSSLPASLEVTPPRMMAPSSHGDGSAGMYRRESVPMSSTGSRHGGRHGDDWSSSAGVAREFLDIVTSERPRVLLSSTHSYHTPPPTLSPNICQTPESSTAVAEEGGGLAYANIEFSAAREGATGQHTPPSMQLPITTTRSGCAPPEPTFSLSPPAQKKAIGDATVAVTKGGIQSSGRASNVFHSSASSARARSARGSGTVVDVYQRSPPPPQRDTSSSYATVSTVRAAAPAFGASAGIFSQSASARGPHRSSNRISGGGSGRCAAGGGGGSLQRFSDASSLLTSSSASFSHVTDSRRSSTTAVELMRRLRANAAA